MGIFLMPFALLLKFFYDFFQSYGIALILFALIIKLVLFPFSLKGKRSMIQMNALRQNAAAAKAVRQGPGAL